MPRPSRVIPSRHYGRPGVRRRGRLTEAGHAGHLSVSFLLAYRTQVGSCPCTPPNARSWTCPRTPPWWRPEDGAGEIDLALIVVPVAAVAGAIDDCVAAGVRWVSWAHRASGRPARTGKRPRWRSPPRLGPEGCGLSAPTASARLTCSPARSQPSARCSGAWHRGATIRSTAPPRRTRPVGWASPRRAGPRYGIVSLASNAAYRCAGPSPREPGADVTDVEVAGGLGQPAGLRHGAGLRRGPD